MSCPPISRMKTDLRVERPRRPEVGQGLHNTLIAAERRPDQVFAVARHRAAGDAGRVRQPGKHLAQPLQSVLDCPDGVAVIALVMIEEQPPASIDQCQLGGRRA